MRLGSCRWLKWMLKGSELHGPDSLYAVAAELVLVVLVVSGDHGMAWTLWFPDLIAHTHVGHSHHAMSPCYCTSCNQQCQDRQEKRAQEMFLLYFYLFLPFFLTFSLTPSSYKRETKWNRIVQMLPLYSEVEFNQSLLRKSSRWDGWFFCLPGALYLSDTE